MRPGAIIVMVLLAATPLSAGTDAVEKRLVEHIDAHSAEALTFLEKLVDVNSGTMNPPGVRAVADMIAHRLEALGFDVKWIDGAAFGRAGHLMAARSGNGPRILLIGHLDTVFEPESPFQRYEQRDGHIAAGPGIVDMKGGIVIILHALDALEAVGELVKLQITVVLIGDEERPGNPIRLARAALVEAAEAADIALAFENGDNDPATAVISRRGFTSWDLQVTGKPAHSSQIFRDDIGAGAIFEASRILDEFREAFAGEEYLTLNPGIILGGTDVSFDSLQARGNVFGKNNVIAEYARVSGDLRTLSPEQLERAKERMREIVAENLPGTTAELSFLDGYPPMAPTDGNRDLLKLLDQVSRDLGYGAMEPVNPSRAGAADVAFAAGYVKMAIDGLGLLGGDEHTTLEWADLRTLPMQTQRTAVLLYRLANSPDD